MEKHRRKYLENVEELKRVGNKPCFWPQPDMRCNLFGAMDRHSQRSWSVRDNSGGSIARQWDGGRNMSLSKNSATAPGGQLAYKGRLTSRAPARRRQVAQMRAYFVGGLFRYAVELIRDLNVTRNVKVLRGMYTLRHWR